LDDTLLIKQLYKANFVNQGLVSKFMMTDTLFTYRFRLAMVRLSQEGHEGKFVRNHVVEFMWKDINNRSKKLGVCFQYLLLKVEAAS
jgi:hypothetical protein